MHYLLMGNKLFHHFKFHFLENRTSKQIIIKNTFWLVISQVAESAIGFFLIVWLARHFGPIQYGEFAFALSFVSIFSAIANFEMSTLVIREVAKDKSKSSEYIDNILILKFAFGIIVFLLIAFSAKLLVADAYQKTLIYLLAIYMIANTFAAFFHAIFRAYEKMQYETLSRVIQSISFLGLAAFFIIQGSEILEVSYAYIGSVAVGILVSLFFVWRYFSKFFLKINYELCKKIILQAWPMSVSSLSVAAHYYLASVFLGVQKSSIEVSLYNVAFKTSFLIIPLSMILFSSFFPQISKFFKEDKEKVWRICSKYITINFVIAIPICIGGIIIAPEIITFLYQAPYEGAIIPFRLLIASSAIAFVTSSFVGCLLAFNKQKSVLKSTIAGAILNLLANSLLIVKYGAFGASVAALVATLLISAISYRDLSKTIKNSIVAKHVLHSLFASLAMTVLLILLLLMGIRNPVYLILPSVVVYFAFFYSIEGKNKLVSF